MSEKQKSTAELNDAKKTNPLKSALSAAAGKLTFRRGEGQESGREAGVDTFRQDFYLHARDNKPHHVQEWTVQGEKTLFALPESDRIDPLQVMVISEPDTQDPGREHHTIAKPVATEAGLSWRLYICDTTIDPEGEPEVTLAKSVRNPDEAFTRPETDPVSDVYSPYTAVLRPGAKVSRYTITPSREEELDPLAQSFTHERQGVLSAVLASVPSETQSEKEVA